MAIPHNAITVVTGVSGSGKSSLAFDTVYAEGQRRYVESLSAYARQFLERMEKPDVDEISGIAPAVAIRQKNSTRNPRSTVATATEIYDYLRLLFARCGQTFCIKCGAEVRRDNPDEIATRVLQLTPGRRFYVLYEFRPGGLAEPSSASAPIAVQRPLPIGSARIAERAARAKKKPQQPSPELLRQALIDLQKRGFNRLYQDGRMHEFSSPETLLDIDFSKPVYVVVDRLAINPESRSRLVDSIEICYREGARRSDSGICGRRQRARRSGCGSTSASNAKTTARCIRSRSRVYFPSTIRMARARAARDSATPSISI